MFLVAQARYSTISSADELSDGPIACATARTVWDRMTALKEIYLEWDLVCDCEAQLKFRCLSRVFLLSCYCHMRLPQPMASHDAQIWSSVQRRMFPGEIQGQNGSRVKILRSHSSRYTLLTASETKIGCSRLRFSSCKRSACSASERKGKHCEYMGSIRF